MDKLYENVKSLVECEIEMIANKKEMTEQDLMSLDKLIDIAKDIEEMNSMESGGGFSGRVNYMPYYGAIGYDDGNSYGRGNRSRAYNNGRNYGRNYEDESRMMPERW